MQRQKILAVTVVIVLTAALLLPLTASAAGWSTPFIVGAGGIKPSVAIDSDGAIHYAWWNPNSTTIQYRKCTGLGSNTCGATENLPRPFASYFPSIAINPTNNRPVVVWEAKDPSPHYSVYFSQRGNNGWSAAKKVSSQTYSELPDVAVGPDGLIHVIYQSKSSDGTQGFIYYSESPDGNNFNAPQILAQVQVTEPLPTVSDALIQGNLGIQGPLGGIKLASGFAPRIAVDANGLAYGVWNAPSPYGVILRHQDGSGGWTNPKTVSSGHKDQTPDVTVNQNGIVGIVWAEFSGGQVSFAEYDSNSQDFIQHDVDGGLTNSFYPKISSDCNGIFHFAFQGGTGSNWDIYHRTYDPSSNQFGGRETIASGGTQQQTPAIETSTIGAIVYNNATSITDASTRSLGITCGPPGPTNTPTSSPTPTDPSNPPPSPTPTPTKDVANDANKTKITYTGAWTYKKPGPASCLTKTDYSYATSSSTNRASYTFNGTKVKYWFLKYSSMGSVRILIDNGNTLDTTKSLTGNNTPACAFYTFNVPAGQHTIEIRGAGNGNMNLDAFVSFP